MPDTSKPPQAGQLARPESWPEMPEARMLLSLRGHETRTRRRLAVCDELFNALEALHRAASALSASGVGSAGGNGQASVSQAPASAHTICSLIRDFAAAVNQVFEIVELDTPAEFDVPQAALDSPVAPEVRRALAQALSEHTALKSWPQVAAIGLEYRPPHRLQFSWSTAMANLQTDAKRAFPALRPVVALAERTAADAITLIDPFTGPIAEERANAYTATKRLRAQIEHIRGVVNKKCDSLESEMREVQTAIVKAQSHAISLMRKLSTVRDLAN